MAVVAGCSFGGFLVFSKLAGELGLFSILALIRAASVVLMLGIWATIREKRTAGELRLWIKPCLTGVFDGFGNLFYVMATRSGRLEVSAALSCLYSAVTVFLAFIFLNEPTTHISCALILTARSNA